MLAPAPTVEYDTMDILETWRPCWELGGRTIVGAVAGRARERPSSPKAMTAYTFTGSEMPFSFWGPHGTIWAIDLQASWVRL